MNRDLLYQKYITENMSIPQLSKHFDVSQKKIFDELHIYEIKKEDGWWLDGLSKQYKKVVLQYDLKGNLIKEWEGIVDITREFGYNGANIANCCRNIIKSSQGYIWRYKDEWLELPNFDNKVSNNIHRPIKQLDLDRNLVGEYNTITEAGRINKLKTTNIRICCEGKAKTHKGYIWEFV